MAKTASRPKKTPQKSMAKKETVTRPKGTKKTLKGAKKTQKGAKKHPICAMHFAKVYPLYIAKAEKKGRSKGEVDKIIQWLTGYTPKILKAKLDKATDIETFFAKAKLNPKRSLITGSVCGVQVQAVTDPTMREVKYLDKLIDELAKGRAMEKILRT
ncbi:unnamed protein product [Effrenium voratum]|nr:unnamed protein product [Effrenium voratum]